MRPDSRNETSVERKLDQLGADRAPDHDVTPEVLRAIRGRPRIAQRTSRQLNTLIAAVAGTTIVAGCVALPQVRSAIGDIFRGEGIVVGCGAVGQASPAPAASLGGLDTAGLGRRSGVTEVERAFDGALLLPRGLGNPEAVFRRNHLVTLVFRASEAQSSPTVLMEVLQPSRPLLRKTVHTGLSVRRLKVAGSPAIWIRGPQELVYLSADARAHGIGPVGGGDTLIWEHKSVTFRLQTPAGLSQALHIARSLH